MADIFISDREIYDTNPEAVLYRVLKEVKDIKETIFDMSSEASCLYEPVRVEEVPKELPNFNTFFRKPESRRESEYKMPESSSAKTYKSNKNSEDNLLRRTYH